MILILKREGELNMTDYNCGDRPTEGVYQCGDCSKEIEIDGTINVLAPCPSCGSCSWIQVNTTE
ncbi:hypothetical protein MBCUT_10840 [Methanobrevibacter cuticularis]|uniref:Zinc ribbon domain protein n=2 Tax=Methanobrevibacter cuticularis TaxID=47311 RepID=A0A166CQT5_9EURY|nr:hypothetical protein MBCUT_10840 [Methanobrevibacter cuticularis]